MAKAKTLNGTSKVPNKALHSRVSYLYQAATYLATQRPHSRTIAESESQRVHSTTKIAYAPADCILQPASRHMVSDLRSVSRKLLMRLSPAMKLSICKNCDTMLIDGSTCTSEVENKSKGGKKRWADVLVRRCDTCGFEKRLPIGAERQKRRPKRLLQEKATETKSGTREEG